MSKNPRPDKRRGSRKEKSAVDFAAIPAGGKIAIAVVKKDPNLRRISIADQSIAILPVSAVERIGLTEGMRWSDELRGKIEAAIEGAKARKLAMKLLSRRGLSRDEVRKRLEKRGSSPAVAAEVVAELQSHGWIDEKAVADSVVRETARKGPASGEFVRRKLRTRGVKNDAAEAAAASSAAPASGIADAEAFARKRLAKMDAEMKPSTKARRVARALAGRGFDDETISTILNRIDLGSEASDD